MQCVDECGQGMWPVDTGVKVDAETLRAGPPLPVCPRCGGLARPNILMFGDYAWDDRRVNEQYGRYVEWQAELRAARARVVVIECGAGKAIPTVRLQAQKLARELGGLLVRINVREPEVPAGHIGLATGAKAALTAIDARIAAMRRVTGCR